MPQLLVRDVDEDVVRLLKLRAAEAGCSAEALHRSILESALRGEPHSFADKAERLVAALRGRAFSDSSALLRADRDRDGVAA